MKPSFYFVLWIVIYPLLDLFNSSFISNNAFIIALVIVWVLSRKIERMMPDTIKYDRALQTAPALEDVYTGNVASFRKRIFQEANVEIVAAIYFIVTMVVIALSMMKTGVSDWIALVVFGLFAFGSVSRSISLLKANAKLKSNPTIEQCKEIATEVYKQDCAAYCASRNEIPYSHILPEKPKHYNAFKVVSIIFAVVAALFGFYYIVSGAIVMLCNSSVEVGALAGMVLLYGTLAAYFGVKDFIVCIRTKTPSAKIME